MSFKDASIGKQLSCDGEESRCSLLGRFADAIQQDNAMELSILLAENNFSVHDTPYSRSMDSSDGEIDYVYSSFHHGSAAPFGTRRKFYSPQPHGGRMEVWATGTCIFEQSSLQSQGELLYGVAIPCPVLCCASLSPSDACRRARP